MLISARTAVAVPATAETTNRIGEPTRLKNDGTSRNRMRMDILKSIRGCSGGFRISGNMYDDNDEETANRKRCFHSFSFSV